MDPDMLAIMNLYKVFGYIQNQAWNSLSKQGNREIDELNARQVKAMMILYLRDMEGKNPLTLGELAVRLGMKKAAASLLVSDLAEKRFLCRTIDRENRRFIRITPGVKGRRFGDAITERAVDRLSSFLRVLTDDEQKSFKTIAEKINAEYTREVEGEE